MDVRASPRATPPPHLSTGAKVALFAGGLVAITAIVTGLAPWLFVRNLLRDEMAERLASTAAGHAETVRSYVRGQHDRLALVAGRDDLVRITERFESGELDHASYRRRAGGMLEGMRRSASDLRALSIVTRDGRIIASSNDAQVGSDVSGDPAFQRGLSESYVTLPMLTGHQLEVAAPMRRGDGHAIAVVLATIDDTTLARALSRENGIYETVRFRVGSPDGTSIRFRAPVERTEPVLIRDHTPAMRAAVAGYTGVDRTVDPEGQPVLAAHRPVGVHGWGLVAQVEEGEADAPLDQLRWFVAGAFALLLLAIFSSRIAARRFVRSLTHLGATARAYAGGDLDARSNVRGDDELGLLGQSFDQMAGELQRHQRELEQKVEARTRALTQEIVERDRAEKDAEARGRMFQALAQSAPDAIVAADAKGRITFANRSAETMFGWSAEELAGTPLSAIMPERHRSACEAGIQRHLEHSETRAVHRLHDVEGLRRNGEEFPIEIAVAVWRDPAGNPCFTGILRDVTERKRSEEELLRSREELARSERFLHDIVENIPLMLVVKDAKDLRFVLFNRAGEALTGLRSEDVIGHDDHDFFPKEQADFFTSKDREALESRQVIDIPEEPIDTRNGRRLLHTIKDPILDSRGEPAYVLGISEDITQAKEQEEALRSARFAAEDANRAKSHFLANMSHEIRTPMNGILGMTQLLLGLPLEPPQREFAETIERSAHKLLRLLNDILDLSRVEAGQVQLDEIPFDLRDLLGDALQSLGLQAAQSGLDLSYDIPPEVPEHLFGDPDRLRQVLVNLVGNAIKFTVAGEIEIRVQPVDRADDHVTLRFEVRDTGPGIPAEDEARIFEVFEQGDETISGRYGGTGLGLTISRELVRLMGGQLEVESEVGRGSTFHFEITFRLQSPLGREEAVVGHDARILVAAAKQSTRRLITAALLRWGMAPTTATTGAEAIDALHRAAELGRPFELVIVGGSLPDLPGLDLAERLRVEPSRCDVPLLVLASPGGRDEARAARLGIAGWLTWPVRQSDLLEAIQAVLGSEPLAQKMPVAPLETASRLRILVAEDDPVNQKVARVLLERRGHTVIVATNGQQALRALEGSRFDLVLMDVRMPVMDGFEATRAIRERERDTGEHVPIVALTAHAMTGDRERCLAAGMDDYLPKPIIADRLFTTVARAVATADRPSQAGATTGGQEATGAGGDDRAEPGNGTDTLADWEGARTRLGGSEATLRAVADALRSRLPQLLEMLRASHAAHDLDRLRSAAHALKGSVGFLGARPIVEAALILEQHVAELAPAQIDSLEAQLEALIGRLQEELEARA